MLAIEPFPERPVRWQTVTHERVPMHNRREHNMSLLHQRHRHSTDVEEPLLTDVGVRMRVGAGEVDHEMAILSGLIVKRS